MAEKSESLIERIEQVGRGGFGIVYRGRYRGCQEVAIKDITGKLSSEALAEANLLKTLHHPNIIHYIDIITTSQEMSIIMAYANGGSLTDYIRKTAQSATYWRATRQMMIDVAYGMVYLHEKRIVHADLKSLNILLRRNNSAVICDFGLAKIIIDSMAQTTHAVSGTYRWFAPELCLDRPERSSFSSDVWAFGCVLLEIMTKKVPWLDQYERGPVLLNALSKPENATIFQNICLSQRAPEKLRAILCHCCAWSKTDRPSFPTVVRDLISIADTELQKTNQKQEKSQQPTSSYARPSSGAPKPSTKASSSSSKSKPISADVMDIPNMFTDKVTDNSSESENDDLEIGFTSDTKPTQHRKAQRTSEKTPACVRPSSGAQRNSAKTASSCATSKNNVNDAQRMRLLFGGMTTDAFPGIGCDSLEHAFGLCTKPTCHRKKPFTSEQNTDNDSSKDRPLFKGPRGGYYYLTPGGKKQYIKDED